MLFLLQNGVNAGEGDNNINLCENGEGSTTTCSLCDNLNKATDESLPDDFDCSWNQCVIVYNFNGYTWITIDLGAVKHISTILFMGDKYEESNGGHVRSYGTSSDPYDTTTNTVITQSGGTNKPAMVADIDEPGPASLRYIHWTKTGSSFKVSEILCWEKKRIYDTDIVESYDFIKPINSFVTVD